VATGNYASLCKPTTIDTDMHITIDNKNRMLKLVSSEKG
jgi:hypothetical protein